MPFGEAGQWGPRPSHCGHWHWTVMADLSSVWFRMVLGLPFGQLDWLSYVPIWRLPLEQCLVVMTLIPLLVINGDFYLWYTFGLVWVMILYGLGLSSVFLSWYYMDWDCLLLSIWVLYWFGTAFSFPFWILYEFGTAFHLEYYTAFGLVLSQVRSVLQLYLRSFEVEGKP